jgi:hypothetical protein
MVKISMAPKRQPVMLLLLSFLTACSMVPSRTSTTPAVNEPIATDCGCSATGPGAATPTGGLAPAGPAAPSDQSSPGPATPASLDSYRDRWTTYTNPTFGFSFEYPAVYDSTDFGFCVARAGIRAPQGADFQLALGSRTTLTLYKTSQSLPEVVTTFQTDPSSKDFQFESPKQSSVGGTPALVVPYHSGGANRYAEAVFFVQDGMLYRVDTGNPSACDVPALNLRELDAYSHMLDTFQFRK